MLFCVHFQQYKKSDPMIVQEGDPGHDIRRTPCALLVK